MEHNFCQFDWRISLMILRRSSFYSSLCRSVVIECWRIQYLLPRSNLFCNHMKPIAHICELKNLPHMYNTNVAIGEDCSRIRYTRYTRYTRYSPLGDIRYTRFPIYGFPLPDAGIARTLYHHPSHGAYIQSSFIVSCCSSLLSCRLWLLARN